MLLGVEFLQHEKGTGTSDPDWRGSGGRRRDREGKKGTMTERRGRKYQRERERELESGWVGDENEERE